MAVLIRALVAVMLAVFALGFLSPTAWADGDPASDVLVTQKLFVTPDAKIPMGQQAEIGNMLTSAVRRGFAVRVAIIAQPADLGAVTALWDKPTAYASFLGIELSLTYTGRLLVVMPNGFGFYWHGHSATAAYQVLARQHHINVGGDGLATAVEGAVAALAAASGARLTVPAGISNRAPPRNVAVSRKVSGIAVLIALLALAIGATGVLLALRAGSRRRRSQRASRL